MRLACATFLAALLSASVARADNTDFLTHAIRTDAADVKIGQLVLARTSTPAIRRYGATLIRDRAEAAREADAVAIKVGLPVSDRMTQEGADAYAKLAKLWGEDFDRAFLHAMIKNRAQDIKAFAAEAKTDHGPVGRMAQAQLPMLQKHLQQAKVLARTS